MCNFLHLTKPSIDKLFEKEWKFICDSLLTIEVNN